MYIFIYMYTPLYIYIYICVCVCVCVYVCVFISAPVSVFVQYKIEPTNCCVLNYKQTSYESNNLVKSISIYLSIYLSQFIHIYQCKFLSVYQSIYLILCFSICKRRCLLDFVNNVLDCDIVVSRFKHQ